MTFTSWLLTFQDARQAARSAYDRAEQLAVELARVREDSAWCADGSFPDADSLVLLQLSDDEVYPGYFDGAIWRYADSMPVSSHEVVAWRQMPAPCPISNHSQTA